LSFDVDLEVWVARALHVKISVIALAANEKEVRRACVDYVPNQFVLQPTNPRLQMDHRLLLLVGGLIRALLIFASVKLLLLLSALSTVRSGGSFQFIIAFHALVLPLNVPRLLLILYPFFVNLISSLEAKQAPLEISPALNIFLTSAAPSLDVVEKRHTVPILAFMGLGQDVVLSLMGVYGFAKV